MLTALRGATELLMGGRWITGLPAGLRFLGTGTVAGVRVSLWAAALVTVAAIVLARETPLGRRIYAVGSNPQAARLAGLSLMRVKLFVFTLTGFLVGVATVVSVPQLSTIESGDRRWARAVRGDGGRCRRHEHQRREGNNPRHPAGRVASRDRADGVDFPESRRTDGVLGTRDSRRVHPRRRVGRSFSEAPGENETLLA